MANFLAPDLCGSCYYNPVAMKPVDQLWQIPNQELILQGIINDKDRRIAELEAEVALLKKPFVWKGEDLEELTEEVIRNRSIIDFEEGELKVQTLVDFEEGNG